jgi:hypothetical protein
MTALSDAPSREATMRHVVRFARHVGAQPLRMLVALAAEDAARGCLAVARANPSRAPILDIRARELWRLAGELRAGITSLPSSPSPPKGAENAPV